MSNKGSASPQPRFWYSLRTAAPALPGAACKGRWDLFDIPEGLLGGQLQARQEAAKQMCDSCPVRIPCLRYALDNSDTTGIWGGTTDEERARIRKRRDRQK